MRGRSLRRRAAAEALALAGSVVTRLARASKGGEAAQVLEARMPAGSAAARPGGPIVASAVLLTSSAIIAIRVKSRKP